MRCVCIYNLYRKMRSTFLSVGDADDGRANTLYFMQHILYSSSTLEYLYGKRAFLYTQFLSLWQFLYRSQIIYFIVTM